jgi:hypothetical protein
MSEINVLSLGAGVQSTALYLMAARGELGIKLDAAIFADTQDEPAKVYHHLEWLKSLGGPPIITGTAGKLSEDLKHGRNSTGGRFASIPAFTQGDGNVGQTRRQCSKEYKTEVIGKVLRREILGLKPGSSPRGVKVQQFIGISLDEAGRAFRMQRNVPSPRYLTRRFYLIEQNITRSGCVDYNSDKVPHETPRSACTFCPYHNDYEWNLQKTQEPVEFAHSVAVDESLRQSGNVVNRNMDQPMYLHRSCKSLDLVRFDPTPPKARAAQLAMNFTTECEGVCGV